MGQYQSRTEKQRVRSEAFGNVCLQTLRTESRDPGLMPEHASCQSFMR